MSIDKESIVFLFFFVDSNEDGLQNRKATSIGTTEYFGFSSKKERNFSAWIMAVIEYELKK